MFLSFLIKVAFLPLQHPPTLPTLSRVEFQDHDEETVAEETLVLPGVRKRSVQRRDLFLSGSVSTRDVSGTPAHTPVPSRCETNDHGTGVQDTGGSSGSGLC